MDFKTIIILVLVVSVQCFSLISVLSYNGYWLIVYSEEDENLQPGDTIFIIAELYRGEKRITRSILMTITVRICIDGNWETGERNIQMLKG